MYHSNLTSGGTFEVTLLAFVILVLAYFELAAVFDALSSKVELYDCFPLSSVSFDATGVVLVAAGSAAAVVAPYKIRFVSCFSVIGGLLPLSRRM